MTPAEQFRDLLEDLGISDTKLVQLFDADPRLVRRWRSGARPVPPDVIGWLESLARWMGANPPPVLRGRARREDLTHG
jgi:hypothetical protein